MIIKLLYLSFNLQVIIVSSGSSSYSPTILQRSQSLPASRALSTMSSSIHGGKQSVVLTTIAGQHGMMGGHGSSGMGPMASSGRAYTTTSKSFMLFKSERSDHPWFTLCLVVCSSYVMWSVKTLHMLHRVKLQNKGNKQHNLNVFLYFCRLWKISNFWYQYHRRSK